MAFTQNVILEHETVNTPLLLNDNDVYSTQKFILQKPRWIEDTQVSSCDKCKSKFTQLKRRHHCRQCGKIFCNACCKDKMVLPHLDYSGPERVCEDCKPLVNIFYLAFSKEISEVTKALNLLMFYPSLHLFLAELGAMKVICRILTESENAELQIAGLEVLQQFCGNFDLKNKALDHGALPPLLHMCSSHHDDVALHAVTCLSSITEHPDTHNAIVHSNVGNALACLLSMLHSTHEAVQEMLLKILANVSFGSDHIRDKIMQEDLYNGSCLSQVLNTRPLRDKAVTHAVCVVANISASNLQGGQRDQLLSFCNLLSELNDDHLYLLRHLSRGIANCLKVQQNCDIVIEFIPKIIDKCLRSTDHCTCFHGFRTAVSLLKYVPEQTIEVLSRNGCEVFLRCLCGTQDTLDTILNATLARVDMIVKPDNI